MIYIIRTKDTNEYVDAIYYGDTEIEIRCTSKESLNYCTNTPNFSIFTYQSWYRNLTFSNKSEIHRNYIQIKWFSILSDMNKIRNWSK